MASEHRHPLRRRRVLALAGALATAPALAGCLGDGDDDVDGSNGNGDENSVDDATVAELVAENRRFAFELYDELTGFEPGENLFCSPHSISLALAMTYAGARGETESQMAETLRYTLGEDVHAAIEALADELDERSQIDDEDEDGDPFALNVSNAVWGQAEYPFREEYLDVLETHYGAGLQEVDFQSDPEAARETINEWVEAETDEKIEELLPEGSITDLARLVLTNAVYFQASWEKQFDEASTADAEFTALDGTASDVPMMRQSESFPYAEGEDYQAIELPYAGEEVSMVVVLPAAGEFETFEDGLDADRFDEIVDGLETREGTIRLPRFEFDSGVSLKTVLSELGVPVAFDEKAADFSGIADLEETGESLFVHDVYHDAYVAVDEEGTEAAAATGVVVGTDSAPADPFEMTVDRPFCFAIRDRPTDALIFLGRVVDASDAQ